MSWANSILSECVTLLKESPLAPVERREPFGPSGGPPGSRPYVASVVNRNIRLRLFRVSAHLILFFFPYSAQDLELHSAICFHT